MSEKITSLKGAAQALRFVPKACFLIIQVNDVDRSRILSRGPLTPAGGPETDDAPGQLESLPNTPMTSVIV